ncbi:MAG: VWA-like domain-containing protein, partial [Oscillospiraceae bacterium]|nr:VWA-like domain-containing protein [Oscillospiraceae bacterium]
MDKIPNKTAAPERIGQLAAKIIKYAQGGILMNMRFLSAALFRFRLVETDASEFSKTAAFATDGINLHYDPYAIIGEYKSEPSCVVRNMLHTVLHCIFHHPFMATTMSENLWDLSCDIAIERIISEFKINSLSCKREAMQVTLLEGLDDIKPFTAEKIYRYFLDNPADAAYFLSSANLFFADDHSPWYEFQSQNQENDEDNEDSENQEDSEDNDGDDGDSTALTKEEIKAIWKDITESIQVDIETFSREQGDRAGTMMQNIKDVTREKYDYSAFLRRFAVLGEALRINDEEFDYIFYTYGLKLYEKMPLIEPLEYKEIYLIKDFVIAIDTSGSVEGELVWAFINKTYNILKQTESFFTRINLHIVQCDAKIQEVVKIATPEDFDNYLRHATIKGLGGTDFRPVFDYVDALIKKSEFTNLRGLIYFTDGYGTFPAHKPAYDAAFVFIDEIHGDFIRPVVPPWAIKLVLKPE